MLKKNMILVVTVMMVISMLAVCMPSPSQISADDNLRSGDLEIWIDPFIDKIEQTTTVPDGYIGIWDENDLLKIGSGYPYSGNPALSWTYGAKYIQMADIDLTGKNLNGGVPVFMSLTISGTDLTVSIEDAARQPLQGVFVYVDGVNKVTDASGEAVFDNYDNTNSCVVMCGGYSGADPLAMAYTIPANYTGSTGFMEFDSNGNFDPIGSLDATGKVVVGYAFSGIYDGNGHRIIGADIAVFRESMPDDKEAVGIFGVVMHDDSNSESGQIMNLGVEGGSTVSVASPSSRIRYNVGGIVGMMENKTKIYNCYNNNSISATSNQIIMGGIVGWFTGYTDTWILACFNTGDLTGYHYGANNESIFMGGIVAWCEGIIYACYNEGNIRAVNLFDGTMTIGGIVSYNLYWSMHSCHNSGSISLLTKGRYTQVGGIAGSAPAVLDSFNEGSIFVESTRTSVSEHIGVGGLIGNGGDSTSSFNLGSIEVNSLHAGTEVYIAGLVARIAHWGTNDTMASYFLEKNMKLNGQLCQDIIVGGLLSDQYEYHIDRGLYPLPSPEQATGPRDINAFKDQSTFYVGETIMVVPSAEIGYSFVGAADSPLWGIYSQVTSGLPFLVDLASMDISSEPVDQNKPLGGSAVFKVEAGSISALSYQWQVSADEGSTWTDISGATADQYDITNVTSALDGNLYRCVVYNERGALFSKAAALNAICTVTFTDGSDPDVSGVPPIMETGIRGGSFTVPDGGSLAKPGYHVTGWTIDGVDYDTGATYTFSVLGNVDAVPIWTSNDAASVTFKHGLGSDITGNPPALRSGSVGQTFIVPGGNTLAWPGYHVTGWTIDGVDYDTGATYTFSVLGNVDAVPIWVPDDVATVTFAPGLESGITGNPPALRSGSVGQTFTVPDGNTLFRPGYRIMGWTIGGVDYYTGTTYMFSVSGNVNADPIWANNAPAAVIFRQGSGSGISGSLPNSESGYLGQTFIVPDGNTLARAGYSLTGWTIGGTNYNTGATYIFYIRGNVNAVPIWVPNEVASVTFASTDSDVTGSPPGLQSGFIGQTFVVPYGNTLVRPGYVLTGWTIDGTDYVARATYTFSVSGNVDAIPIWTPNTLVSVTFNEGLESGVSGSPPAAKSGLVGQTIIVPDEGSLVRSGYHVTGWKIGGTDYDTGATYTFVRNVTAVPIWISDGLASVTFTMGSEQNVSGNPPLMKSGTIGQGFAVPGGNTLVRPGYRVTGWAIGGMNYAVGATYTFTVSGNLDSEPIWTPNASASVTFMKGSEQNVSGDPPAPEYGPTGQNLTVPGNYTLLRPGYSLTGWKIGSVEYNTGTIYKLSGNVTAVPVWTPNAAALVTFTEGTGADITGSPPALQSGFIGQTFTVPRGGSMERPGYEVTGWTIGITYYAVDATYTFTVSGNVTAEPVWTPNAAASVTFTMGSEQNVSGNPPSIESGLVGQTFIVPDGNTLVRPGYRVTGWTIDGMNYAVGATYTFTVSGNLDSEPIWTPNDTASVTFIGSGYEVTGNPPTLKFGHLGQTFNVPGGNTLVRPGYRVTGWTIDGTDYDTGNVYTFTVSGNVTAIPIWTPNAAASVTFDPSLESDVTGSPPATEFGLVGQTFIFPGGNTLVRPGYSLTGWTINGTDYAIGATYTFTVPGNVTARPIWTPNASASVTFDTGLESDVTGSPPAAKSGLVGQDFNVPDGSSLARPGYYIIGWNIGGMPSDIGTKYVFSIPGNVIAIPIWAPNAPASVTFDPSLESDVTGSPPATESGLVGRTFIVPDGNTLVRPGYQITGWTIKGTDYAVGATYTFTVPGNVTARPIWTPNASASVIFMPGTEPGINGTVPASRSGLVGQDFNVPDGNTLARSGYRLTGWTIDGTDYDTGNIYTFSGNVTAIPIWTPNDTASVTFTMGSESEVTGNPPSIESGLEGQTFIVPGGNTLVRPGYRVTGWTIDGTDYDTGNIYTFSGNVTAEPIWTPNDTASVTFTMGSEQNVSGNPPSIESGLVGQTFIVPGGNTLVRPGYHVTGWTINGTDYAVGATYTFTVSGNVTARPIWTPNASASVIFMPGTEPGINGTVPASRSGLVGQTFMVPDGNTLARSGYRLTGWTIEGTDYDTGNIYTFSGNVTAIPIWTPNASASVTFTKGLDALASGNPPALRSGLLGQTFIVPDGNTLVRPGYHVTGWTIDVTDYDTGNVYTFTASGNVNARPIWTPNVSASVTFTMGSESGVTGNPPSIESGLVGQTFIVPDGNTLVRPGYSLSGWMINGMPADAGTTYTFTVSGNVTAIPIWVMNTDVTISFDGNGGTETMPDFIRPCGSEQSMPPSVFVRAGWSQTGWNTAADGSGTPYPMTGRFVMPSSDLILYAIWQDDRTSFNISASVDGDNGKISPSGIVPVVQGSSVTFSITPNRGYKVSDVLIDGVSVGAVKTYTFDNVVSDHTISVSFVKSSSGMSLWFLYAAMLLTFIAAVSLWYKHRDDE